MLMSEAPMDLAGPCHSPILTTGQLFLHSCLHFFGLHLPLNNGSQDSAPHKSLSSVAA